MKGVTGKVGYIKTGFVVENIKVSIDSEDGDILSVAQKRLSSCPVFGKVERLELYKKSVDARKKDCISFVCSVSGVGYVKDGADPSRLQRDGIKLTKNTDLEFKKGSVKMENRPVVVGFGPAGMFASLALAKNGFRPLVLERGGSVEKRVKAVERFEKEGILDTETNIQFGAGGAGTFSDGKLTTRISDSHVRFVLEMLHAMGAPEDILWRAKPHIGTDILRDVVSNTHKEIERLGGEIRYDTKVDSFGEGFVCVDGEKIYSDAIIIATGHSARDLYSFMIGSGYEVEAKPFSVGVRVEHLQSDIDRAMYGKEELFEKLGHAEYGLSYRKGERGVYTFCMCPGGKVVAAASEAGGVVTNGMSERLRNGRNANAAVAVSVLPSDFGGKAENGIEFQRKLERAAYEAGGRNYFAPCQTLGNFNENKVGINGNRILPSYRDGGVTPCDFNKLFPEFVTSMLKVGMNEFGKRIKGFDAPDVPMTGIETRTSAPLRMLRDPQTYEAVGKCGIYPCGEGAGYAGGIVSAAVDGLRVAGAIISKFSPLD